MIWGKVAILTSLSLHPCGKMRTYCPVIYPEGASECYRDEGFPSSSLTMLGAKTTIKERWRQVLEEANRIERKHLITLEPAVSVDYTNAMRDSKLQLVIPSQLFPTYTPSQQEWLMDVGGFCEMVEERQRVLD